MEGVPKIKLGAAHLLRRPLGDKFLNGAIVPALPTSIPNFNFLALIVFEIEGSQNLMWGYYPLPYHLR